MRYLIWGIATAFPPRFLTLLGVATVLTLAACATPTPYQPIIAASPAQGGYYEKQLAPDRWQVSFAGNTLTSRETVEGYLLYRAAELTLEQDRGWFEILDREVEREVRRDIYRDPLYDPWWGYPNWRPYWRYYNTSLGWRYWYPGSGDPFWAGRSQMRTVERYEVHANILMHRGAKPPGNGRSFDARDVLEMLEPRIKRPKG